LKAAFLSRRLLTANPIFITSLEQALLNFFCQAASGIVSPMMQAWGFKGKFSLSHTFLFQFRSVFKSHGGGFQLICLPRVILAPLSAVLRVLFSRTFATIFYKRSPHRERHFFALLYHA
jgi:hypothetical protein